MKEQRNGLLLVVSGPSGVGKGTLVKALMDRNSRIKMSVSATTRAPRPGEIDGVHYFFKTEEEFKAMVDRGEFLEYIHVFGSKYYGTPRSFVEQQLENGFDVILEIDVQGHEGEAGLSRRGADLHHRPQHERDQVPSHRPGHGDHGAGGEALRHRL